MTDIDADLVTRAVAKADAEAPTVGQVAEVLADSGLVDADIDSCYQAVEDAIDAGHVVEGDDGALGGVRVPDGQQPATDDRSTGEPDADSRAHAAFEAAVEFFHDQLDRDIGDHTGDDGPDTPREYYEDRRGWSPDTIADKRLGYAPADEQALLDHLMREGFDRDAILGTGLFYEGFTPHFVGRYVLPYFDEDGDPVYAISRSLNRHEDGHEADPKGDQKYTKAVKTKEYTEVDEPIYGAETVDDDTNRLLVAGGIADAITLHEAGYDCISPVTTVRFKEKHEARVLDLVDRHDIDGVYMLNDAERPTVDREELEDSEEADCIRDALTIKQFGEGLRGAFGNAEFLLDADIDPYLVHLPGGDDDLRKLDPDDLVKEGWASVKTVLASASHAGHDPRYRDWQDTRQQRELARAADGADWSGSGDGSALFDLTFTDVAPVSLGDRVDNPLGHHGDSHGYFVCVEKHGEVVGYDHKYKVGYNALTYLLCAAGERRADSPNGRMDDSEIWAAWRQAKQERLLPDDDPIPHRALKHLALANGYAEPDDIEDGWRLPADAYNRTLRHVRETHGFDPGRSPLGGGDGSKDDTEAEEEDTDPLAVDVTVDPRAAWRAAGAVAPADLDCEPPADSDGDGFACPDCGDRVDIVRAVAIAEGFVEDCTDDLAGDYPRAYETAREAYGAPLPRYYTTTDAVAEMEAVIELKNQLGFFDLDHEAMESEITERGDEVGGEAVLALNPSWRDSFSESSVLVYESGNVWDADTERNFRDMLHFVALDAGVIDDIACYPRKTQFVEAYRLARNEYGAPLPRWVATDTDLDRDLQAMLPDAEDLEADAGPPLGVDTDALEDARDAVEELVKEATAEPEQPTVISAFPGTGKTTGTVKTARSRPLSYLAARKELQAQALDKAERWGVEARILPVFAEDRIREEVLADAVSHVREAGKDRLRDQHAILAAAVGDDEDQASIFDEDDEDDEDDDTVDLDRPTCDTAEGRHGPAWALAFHVARELGYTPQQIHDQALGLFGAHPPCGCESDASDDGDCPYSVGWEEAADPDDPADLLVGSYVHAHVESVRTLRTRGPDGRIQRSPRPVVLDEYPGNAYVSRFGEEALDHATWLACALRDDVADRRDMVNADLHGDDWVRAWLDGNGADIDAIADASDRLARLADLYEAEDGAADILDRVADDDLAEADLHDPLAALADGGLDARVLYRDLASAIGAIDPADEAAGMADWVRDVVLDPLASATLEGAETPTVDAIDTDALPASGELAGLVETAVEAAAGGDPNAPAAIDAAVTALGGGTEGCRRLAAWADDGYAHPDAHHLLRGVITPTGEDTDHDGLAARVATDEWAFDPDATDGTVVDTVDTGERARVVLDRNDHGALLRTPPARTAGNGDPTPLVGLDATARAPLWGQSLGESVLVADIHDTPAERAAFAADALGLKVIRAADRPRFYEGDPRTKDTDGDVTLLRRIAEDYSGLQAPRERGAEPVVVGKPAAITTKGVRNLLESDSRLDDVVAEWANYGDMKGANGFGGYQLGAVLGCQHYGDAAIERFAAMAGEEVNTDRGPGRGGALDYESDIANAYLKHMTEDQTMQAILRFSRGESGATVVARTSALRDDLPVVGRGQVVETWSETATRIAAAYRRLGDRFTVADVADTVDVTKRQVRRVLAELAEAGYVRTVRDDPGIAKVYEPAGAPGAGEASLPAREDVVEVEGEAPGQGSSNEYYTWNVRVIADLAGGIDAAAPAGGPAAAGPPAPEAAVGLRPPD